MNRTIHNKTKNRSKNNKNKTKKSYKKDDKPPFPIDVVYTWIGEKKTNNPRTSFNNELKYSLRSLYYFAPWVNKIYILMNPPKKMPSWIKENYDKIVLVDHFETFPSKKYLPNTNSFAIETVISNIKYLSEHFIYFNDDFFLGRKSKYTDFFTSDGKAVVDWQSNITSSIYCKKSNTQDKITINNTSIIVPPNNGNWYPHIPINRIKSLYNEFIEKYPDYIEYLRKYKKRHYTNTCMYNSKYNLPYLIDQLHYPIANYMYSKKKAVLINNEYRTYYVNSYNIQEHLENVKKLRPLFFCINDIEHDTNKREKIRKITLRFYREYYPHKPPYEK